MNAVDVLRLPDTRVAWSRVDPDKPPGIHLPKLQGDVGWDLEAMEDIFILPMQACDVPVNLKLQLPSGYYAEIRNRSSMAKRGLYVDQNIVDTGFRGSLYVMIRNMRMPVGVDGNGAYMTDNFIKIRAGERVAQLLFHRVNPVWMDEVSEVDISTERATNGFGSTGR